MISVLLSVLLTLRGSARSHTALQLEVLALRHQLQVLHRARSPRLRLTEADRLLWVWLAWVWNNWRTALVIVKPETVIAWHRCGFRLLWTWKSRQRTGRPTVPPDVRALIRTMSRANPLWGAPRIPDPRRVAETRYCRLSGDRCEGVPLIRLPRLEAHACDFNRRAAPRRSVEESEAQSQICLRRVDQADQERRAAPWSPEDVRQTAPTECSWRDDSGTKHKPLFSWTGRSHQRASNR